MILGASSLLSDVDKALAVDGARVDVPRHVLEDLRVFLNTLAKQDAGGGVLMVYKPKRESVSFDDAWDEMKLRGFQYGPDALEQVRLGWDLAHGKLPR